MRTKIFLASILFSALTYGQKASDLVASAKADIAADPESFDAGDKLTKAIKIDPSNAEAYYLYAKLCQEQGNSTEAKKNIDKALAISPANNEYLWLRARTNMRSNSSKESLSDAVKDLNQMLANGVKTADVYKAIGTAEKEIGNYIYRLEKFDQPSAQKASREQAIGHLVLARAALEKAAAVSPKDKDIIGYKTAELDRLTGEIRKSISELK